MVGIGDSAKAVAGDFQAVSQRSDAGNEGDSLGGRGGLCSGEDGTGDAAGTPFNGGEKLGGVEWRNEESAAGGVGDELVAIGEEDGHAGSETAVDVKDSEGGALAANKLARKEQDTGMGRRWSLLCEERDHNEQERSEEREEEFPAGGRDGHNEIVVENRPVLKSGWLTARPKK